MEGRDVQGRRHSGRVQLGECLVSPVLGAVQYASERKGRREGRRGGGMSKGQVCAQPGKTGRCSTERAGGVPASRMSNRLPACPPALLVSCWVRNPGPGPGLGPEWL